MSFEIIGFGKGAPALSVTNDMLSQIVDTNDEWISSRTGIRSRHFSQGETLTDLSAAAARQALDWAKLPVDKLDYIICSTVQGDYITPSLACLVQRELGATCPAFDVNAACTGFIYNLDLAAALLDSGKAEHILVISAEMMSKHLDWDDRTTCVLFGDGAGAAVLRKGSGLRSIVTSAMGNEGPLNGPTIHKSPYFDNGVTKAKLAMQGSEVFKFAVSHMTRESKSAMAAANVTTQDIKKFLPHQANARIIRSSTKNLGFTEEQVAVNIERYGNTSSATIPILLCELMESGALTKGDTILMAAMGGGLTSGAAVVTL